MKICCIYKDVAGRLKGCPCETGLARAVIVSSVPIVYVVAYCPVSHGLFLRALPFFNHAKTDWHGMTGAVAITTTDQRRHACHGWFSTPVVMELPQIQL